MYAFDEVKNYDPDLAKAIEQETQRQNDHIELIASENFVSKAEKVYRCIYDDSMHNVCVYNETAHKLLSCAGSGHSMLYLSGSGRKCFLLLCITVDEKLPSYGKNSGNNCY